MIPNAPLRYPLPSLFLVSRCVGRLERVYVPHSLNGFERQRNPARRKEIVRI